MKSKNYFLMLILLALASLSWGQATCPGGLGTAQNNWCGPYTIQMMHCMTGSGNNTCISGNYPFATISPTNDAYGNYSFFGINASQISNASTDVAPNGAAGPYEYLQFASGYVQAFEKDATGDSGEIFGSPNPQPVANPFSFPHNNPPIKECNNFTSDVNVSYDHISNSNFIIAGIAQPNNSQSGVYKTLCIAVSTTNDLDSVSCQGPNGCAWNAYTYNITSMLPNPTTDLADYPRFGTWSDGYYMAFDFINTTPAIEGTAVCKLNRTAFLQGEADTTGAICYSRLVPPQNYPPMVHTILPADAETSVPPPTLTNGEYFLATVNPGSDGNPCTGTDCTSDQLAYFTWNNITNKIDWLSVPVNSFIPGCYDSYNPSTKQHSPAYTNCIPQYNSSILLDSVGDRLMSPLAYSYFPDRCEEGTHLYPSCEYLAVTQTIQLTSGSYGSQTGIRYYALGRL